MAGSIIARMDKTLPGQIASMDAARDARMKARRQDFATVMAVLGGRQWVRDLERALDKLFAVHACDRFEVLESQDDMAAFWIFSVAAMGGSPAAFPRLTAAEGAKWIIASGKDCLPADCGPLLAELGRFAALVREYVAQA